MDNKSNQSKPATKAAKPAEKPWVCPDLPRLGYSYGTIKRLIKSGNVPKEWDELYDGIHAMIEKDFASNPYKTFFSKEIEVPYRVGNNYYKDGKDAAYSPAILLNEYLSKRLKSEGYDHACIRLIYIPSQGSMWAKQINAMRQSAYNAELAEWQSNKYRYDTQEVNEILGSVPNPGKAPTAPTMMSTSYTSSKYVFMVQCSKGKSRRAKKSEKQIRVMQRKKTGSKLPAPLLVLLAYVLPVLALGAILAATVSIAKLVDPEIELMVILLFGSIITVGGGLALGWGFHSALYKNGYLS